MSEPVKEENYAKDQARAQYESICEMVAALEVDYDRLDELRNELEAVHSDEAYDLYYGNKPIEFMIDLFASDDFYKLHHEAVEYKQLLAAAGDCENQDAARDRIQEDPLSIQVRSGWVSPGGDEMVAEDFEILLCTGGPAVRIMGELDENLQPDRAWLEYQDWGTPWTHYFDVEQSTLLAYCREFYFGG